jgi:hypothetical protein
MKIYVKAQMNQPAIDPNAQALAMQSLVDLTETMQQFAEDQKQKKNELTTMTQDTMRLFEAANMPTDFLNNLLMVLDAMEAGALSDIESISLQMSSGTAGQTSATIGPMNAG